MARPVFAPVSASADLLKQVETILGSSSFTSSDTLRSLLRYLAQRTIESPDNPPKEHEIATSLLGSPANFDPKLDPVVRVNISRLRSKLAEYYVAEGAGDPVYIDVPKGTYRLHATYRRELPVPVLIAKAVPVAPRRSRRMWLAAGSTVLLLIALGVWKLGAPNADAGLRQFWRPFLESAKEPLVIFANPKMVGSSSSSLRLYDPDKDQGATVNPNYSGVGEVIGAAELSRMFSRLGRHIRLKRSQLFNWDDANAYTLIFIGAPPHNGPLFHLALGRKLKFKPYGEEPRKEDGCIQNPQPQKGEDEIYCTSFDGATSTEYALATFSESVEQAKFVLFAAGTTTLGTQATVEFLCDPERVSEIARLLGVRLGGRLPAFDALIRCRIRSGAPVSATLVLVKQ